MAQIQPSSCPQCGAVVVPGQRFCPKCGLKMDAQLPESGSAGLPQDYQPPVEPPLEATRPAQQYSPIPTERQQPFSAPASSPQQSSFGRLGWVFVLLAL